MPAAEPVPVAGQHAENQRSLMAENGEEAMEVILHWDCAGSTAEQYGPSFGEGCGLR